MTTDDMTDFDRAAHEGYQQFRGKCKEMSEAAVAADPTLRLVRGYYFDPYWCRDDPHWWTERPDGTIFDPTARQYPSNGAGLYTEFDGTFECAECRKTVAEEDAIIIGNGHYPMCSNECCLRFVGL